MSKESIFDKLNKINVNDHTEKKGQFTYLSWAYAVKELLKVAPDATWEIHEYDVIHGSTSESVVVRQPYMITDSGCFVKVTLTVNNIARTQVHPVLDHRNQTVKDPNAFQINTSIQRCLAKAIALHGLGLYIYAGEDLPEVDLTPEQIKNLLALANEIDEEQVQSVANAVDSRAIHPANYENSVKELNKRIKESKSEK